MAVTIKQTFDMYLNECKFEDDYIDDEALVKASEQIHQYFDREVAIRLSEGYELVFEPIGASSSFLVGKILANDASNLQNFIGMLRFRRIAIRNKNNSNRKNKIAAAIDKHIQFIHDSHDIDGFTSYNPGFIPDVIASIKKAICKFHESCDFSVLGLKKLSESEVLTVYQLYQELLYVLDLFFAY